MTATAPGCWRISRTAGPSAYSTTSETTDHTRPSKTVRLSFTGRGAGTPASGTASEPDGGRAQGCARCRAGGLRPAGGLQLGCGAHEPREPRVRLRGARQELGVSLRGDVVRVRVARQLDELDELTVGRLSRDDQAGGLELRTVLVVHLVPVAVTLAHRR